MNRISPGLHRKAFLRLCVKIPIHSHVKWSGIQNYTFNSVRINVYLPHRKKRVSPANEIEIHDVKRRTPTHNDYIDSRALIGDTMYEYSRKILHHVLDYHPSETHQLVEKFAKTMELSSEDQSELHQFAQKQLELLSVWDWRRMEWGFHCSISRIDRLLMEMQKK